jgi:hypothetical protein
MLQAAHYLLIVEEVNIRLYADGISVHSRSLCCLCPPSLCAICSSLCLTSEAYEPSEIQDMFIHAHTNTMSELYVLLTVHLEIYV